MANYICAFIKFVEKKQYAEDFVNGFLYCNPWIAYEKMENSQRRDNTETAESIRNWVLHIEKTNFGFRYKMILKNKDDFYTPVFCMYSVFTKKYLIPEKLHLVNKKLKGFGNYCVVIWNVEEFINRLNIYLPGNSYGVVEYLDFDHLTGKNKWALTNSIIQKDKSKFAHQQEFRIYNRHIMLNNQNSTLLPIKEVVATNEHGAAKFSMGKISDIAEIILTDQLFSGINIKIIVNDWENISKEKMSKEFWWDGFRYQEL